MKKIQSDINAFKLILPKEVFEYFEVIGLKEDEQQVDISGIMDIFNGFF